MCGDCFVCIYLVCQCDGLELGRRNRRITVRGVAVRINKDSSRRQSKRTCVNLTPRCPYGTTVWKDEPGSTTSWQRITISSMEQLLILQPWLRRVIYHPFANLDGMSGATIVNRWLLFPTIMKYLDESWASPR